MRGIPAVFMLLLRVGGDSFHIEGWSYFLIVGGIPVKLEENLERISLALEDSSATFW